MDATMDPGENGNLENLPRIEAVQEGTGTSDWEAPNGDVTRLSISLYMACYIGVQPSDLINSHNKLPNCLIGLHVLMRLHDLLELVHLMNHYH